MIEQLISSGIRVVWSYIILELPLSNHFSYIYSTISHQAGKIINQ